MGFSLAGLDANHIAKCEYFATKFCNAGNPRNPRLVLALHNSRLMRHAAFRPYAMSVFCSIAPQTPVSGRNAWDASLDYHGHTGTLMSSVAFPVRCRNNVRCGYVSVQGHIVMSPPSNTEELKILLKASLAKDRAVREEARQALDRIGKDAIPHLVSIMKRTKSVRWEAAKLLGKFIPASREAITGLISVLRHETNANEGAASSALKAAGPTIIPDLIKGMVTSSRARIIKLLLILHSFGAASKPALWILIGLLRVQINFIHDLERFNIEPPVTFVEDADECGSQSDEVFALPTWPWEPYRMLHAVLAVLGAMGEEAQEALPTIITALNHELPGIRSCAIATLRQLGPAAKPATHDLIRALCSDAWNVREMAALCLSEIGADVNVVVQPLIARLDDEDTQVRVAAVVSLGRFSPALEETVVPALIRKLEDPTREVRRTAAWTVSKFGPSAKAALPVLGEMLNDADEYVRSSAMKAVIAIGPEEVAHKGLDLMGDEAVLAEEALNTFRRIGELCKKEGVDWFRSNGKDGMESQLGLADSTITTHIDKCSSLFRKYFKKYEMKVDVEKDTAKGVPKERKIFDRTSGRPAIICHPLGWRAWELACQFLEPRDRAEAAMRRAKRQNS